MGTIRTVELFYQEGSSDKVYRATLVEEADGTFTVRVEWGRRGAPLQRGAKAAGVDRARAEREYDKVVREKTAKGYQEVTAEVQPADVAPPEGQGSGTRSGRGGRASTGQAAQLLVSCGPDEVERLLRDDRVLAQQKLDGERILVHLTAEGPLATNRSGQHKAVARAVLAALADLPEGTIVDGELVEGTLHLFDLLQHGAEDWRAEGYLDRWLELDALADHLEGPVRLVPIARGEVAKRALLERLRAARAEGIVFKRRDAPYTPGRPASGGAQHKHKFVKAADVVLTHNAGNAYAMVLYDAGGRPRSVGKVFAGTTNAIRADLDARLSAGEHVVAEVEYLYATADDQLFQPVFRRVRDDKEPGDCTVDQLEHTNRAAH